MYSLSTIMPSRCCVINCSSNYDSDVKETGKIYPVFSFPAKDDPERSRKEWFESLPNVITDTQGKKICIRHWPENFETINRTGHQVPAKPPSVWPVPNSCCRQTVPKARNPSQRGVDSESRKINAAKRRLSAQEKADTISDFTALEKHCRSKTICSLQNVMIIFSSWSYQMKSLRPIPSARKFLG